MSQTAHAVFNDDHSAIDNDPKIERPQAHQVGTDLITDHAGKSEQHRQGNDHCGDNRCPDIAQEQEQNHDDQDGAFGEVLFDRVDGLVHQHRPVIYGHRLHAFR